MRHFQKTVSASVSFDGVGVHSGQPVELVCRPAEPNSGIIFRRRMADGQLNAIPARREFIGATELCTTLGDTASGVATIEHLMATIAGLGIDNLLIDVDGPEVPILDGSALPFVEKLAEVGLIDQLASRRYIRVTETVRVERGASFAELRPHNGFKLDVSIDFEHPSIGRQRYVGALTPSTFRRDLAAARTFGFFDDVERLRAAGFARGAGLQNAVVFDRSSGVINEDGLRFADECVRHKALDAVGDLALAGLPILGEFVSSRGGHAINAALVAELFAHEDRWMNDSFAPSRPIERTVRPAAVATR